MDGGTFQIAFPKETFFPLPASLPAGLKQFSLRQVQYNSIPASGGTPAATEIQLIVAQYDGCWMDPSTTSLYIEATAVACWNWTGATLAPPAGNAPGGNNSFMMAASSANGGMIGSGASIFQRYQLYLNNATLSDDISEFGLVSHLQYLLSYDEAQREIMAATLGFNPSEPSSTWGIPFHGAHMYTRSTWQINGTVATTLNVNSSLGSYIGPSYNSYWGGFWISSNAQPITIIATQKFNFSILLPGLLGTGNPKLFPLMAGPTRISLFTDNQNNYFQLDFGQNNGVTGAPVLTQYINAAVGNTPALSFTVNQVWLHADCLRCDAPSFNVILSQLPIPNTVILKTTAWTVSSTNIQAGTQGSNDILVAPRRASVKSLYVLCSPFGVNPTLYSLNGTSGTLTGTGFQYNMWGKYGWCNPNLTSGTCVVIAGVQWPQQTTDPMARPTETFTQLLKSLRTWSTNAVKPCLPASNYFVCDSLAGVTIGGGAGFYASAPALQNGQNYWRTVTSTTFRQNNSNAGGAGNVGPLLSGLTTASGAITAPIPLIIASCNPGVVNATLSGAIVSMTDKTAQWKTSQQPDAQCQFIEGTSHCNKTTLEGGFRDYHSQIPLHKPYSNCFIFAQDFENMAKTDYLSGVSTLSGNFFFRMVINQQLIFGYNIYFVVCHDMLTIFDLMTRTITVRI